MGLFQQFSHLNPCLGGGSIVSTGFLQEGVICLPQGEACWHVIICHLLLPLRIPPLFPESPLLHVYVTSLQQHCFLLPFLSLRCSEGNKNSLGEVRNLCIHSTGIEGSVSGSAEPHPATDLHRFSKREGKGCTPSPHFPTWNTNMADSSMWCFTCFMCRSREEEVSAPRAPGRGSGHYSNWPSGAQ